MNGTEFVLIVILVVFAVSVFVTSILCMRRRSYTPIVRIGYIIVSYISLIGTSCFVSGPSEAAFLICIAIAAFSCIKVVYDAMTDRYLSDRMAVAILAFEAIAPIISAIIFAVNITKGMSA